MKPTQYTMDLPTQKPKSERLTANQREALLELNATPRWIMDIGPGMVKRLRKRGLVSISDKSPITQLDLFGKHQPIRSDRRRQVVITDSGKTLILATS